MLISCSLKRYRGSKSCSRHRLSFPCEPRNARSVGGLINNRYAKADFDENEEKRIVFDRNFQSGDLIGRILTIYGRERMTLSGRKTKPQINADYADLNWFF